jgi:hypothetical protein
MQWEGAGISSSNNTSNDELTTPQEASEKTSVINPNIKVLHALAISARLTFSRMVFFQ